MSLQTDVRKIPHTGDHTISQRFWIVATILKLDEVAPVIAHPTTANCTTIHNRVFCLDRNLCHGKLAYLHVLEKPA